MCVKTLMHFLSRSAFRISAILIVCIPFADVYSSGYEKTEAATGKRALQGNHSVEQLFYVSVTGNASGDGSESKPWDLQTALNQPAAISPGSTICIQPGTYHGNFTSNLAGTAAAPIIVRSCSGGRVVLDGNRAGQANKNVNTLLINGRYTWFWGLEITNSDPERIITQSGSNPPERRGAGIAIFAPGIKLINLIIYDNGEGIDAWTPAENIEVYGNLIYNNGWYAPDREHGHGIYTQNNTGTKKFIDNIVLNNFGYAWQVFGSNQSTLKNYYIEGNTVFNDRWLIGGAAPMDNIELVSNFTYKDTLQLGYFSNVVNTNLTLRDNFFASLLKVYYWKNVRAASNTLFSGSSLNYPVLFSFEGTPDFSTIHFDSNTYYWSTPPPAAQQQVSLAWENNTLPEDHPDFDGLYSIDQWKAMGQDLHSTVQNWPKKDESNLVLSGSKVFVRKNKYDSKRAHITVYNWGHADVVKVDVTNLLKPGESYQLHNVQNYFGDVITGVYEGGPLSVPMKNHTVAKPLGYPEELGPNTFGEFGAFVLIIGNESPDSIVSTIQHFEAVAENKAVRLTWSTAGQENAKYYCIQRSTDGIQFDSIGFVSPAQVAQQVNDYRFMDYTPVQGDNYYRLKKVLTDGRFGITPAQKVVFTISGFDLLLLGNPANNELRVNLRLQQPSDVKIKIVGAAGHEHLRLTQSYPSGSFIRTVPISQLPAGVYFLTVTAGNEVITRRFIRQ